MGNNVIEVIKIWYKYIVDIIPFWVVKIKNIFCISIFCISIINMNIVVPLSTNSGYHRISDSRAKLKCIK